jgi:hypothetical protein
VAEGRLTERPDGIYEYEFKRPWADGTHAVLLDPEELVEKLAALVPPPRANLVRYHGVLAPAAKWREAVVPTDADRRATSAPGGAVPPDRVPWAQLLYRVFLTDVLRCPDCGGRRSVLAAITDEVAARRILLHLGLDAAPALLAPSRGPPGHDTWDEAADIA